MSEAPDQEIERIAGHLGHDFLAYVSNSTPEEVAARITSRNALVPQRRELAFSAAVRLAGRMLEQREQMSVNGRHVLMPPRDSLEGFAGLVPEERVSLATYLRVLSNGPFPDLGTEDPLKHAFRSLALDWFPMLLLPRDDEPDPFPDVFGASTFIHRHPARENVIAAVRDESEPLHELFSGGDRSARTREFAIIHGLHRARRERNPAFSAHGKHGDRGRDCVRLQSQELTPSTYLNAVDVLVDEIWAVSEGKRITVPALVGLGSAVVEDGFFAETPWGTLTSPGSWDRMQVPATGPAATLVLQTTYDLVLDFDFDMDVHSAAPPRFLLEAEEAHSRRVDAVRLSVLLAIEREAPVALLATWTLISHPFSPGGASRFALLPGAGGGEINITDRASIEKWAALVDEHHHPQLNLAARRTLSSISARYDSADALIDAVIALESLFGTGSSEVSFRLSAALAWLFEDESAKRADRQKALAKLYGLRSKIVHGEDVPLSKLYGLALRRRIPRLPHCVCCSSASRS